MPMPLSRLRQGSDDLRSPLDPASRGGRVVESLAIVRAAGGSPVAVAMLVDRSSGTTRFDVPAISLLELSFPTYPADHLPPELAAIPAIKPGSRGLK